MAALLDFYARLSDAWAWPFVALVTLILFRRPLLELIPLLQHLKFPGGEADFARRTEELRDEAREELGPTVDPAARQRSIPLYELAETSPRAAIIEAWLQVEQAAVEAAERLDLLITAPRGRPRVIEVLQTQGQPEREALGLARELQSLRNEAAHQPRFALTAEAAIAYIGTASFLIDHLSRLGREQ